jgi:hypothetical protein
MTPPAAVGLRQREPAGRTGGEHQRLERRPNESARFHGHAQEFFEYIEKKYATRIPEVSGDITSAWTDDPGIFAQATGMKRKAAAEILAAEKFATIDELLGTDRPYPRADINKTYGDMLVYTTTPTV